MSLLNRDCGPMARATGKLVRGGAEPLPGKEQDGLAPSRGRPLRVANFLVPLGVLLGLIVTLMATTGGWPKVPLGTALTRGDSAFAAVCYTIALYRLQDLPPWQRLIEGCLEGMRSIFLGMLILIFAWGIGLAVQEVGTARYVVGIAGGPGSRVDTPAGLPCRKPGFLQHRDVLMPRVAPLVCALTDSMALLFPAIGAVFAGSVFGDHCSPISDMTVNRAGPHGPR